MSSSHFDLAFLAENRSSRALSSQVGALLMDASLQVGDPCNEDQNFPSLLRECAGGGRGALQADCSPPPTRLSFPHEVDHEIRDPKFMSIPSFLGYKIDSFSLPPLLTFH